MDVTYTKPLLPLRDIVIFPSIVVPLFVGREKSIKALQEAMKTDKSIILVAQKNSETDDPLEKDFDYKVSETIKQKAIYGEFTFHTSDKIDVTLGFRHFSLDADGESDMRFALYDLPPG